MIEVESKFKISGDITQSDLLTILKEQLIAPILSKHQIDTVFLLPEQVDAPVDDGNAARQMLTALGWQKVVTVDKIRLESKT